MGPATIVQGKWWGGDQREAMSSWIVGGTGITHDPDITREKPWHARFHPHVVLPQNQSEQAVD